MSTTIRHTNNLIYSVYDQSPELEIQPKNFENLMDSLMEDPLISLFFKTMSLKKSNKVINIKDKINKVLTRVEIPYNIGKAYYYLDNSRKKIRIFIPVERLRGEVGIAIVKLFNIFEEEMPEWHVNIEAKLNQNIDAWGVSTKKLIQTIL